MPKRNKFSFRLTTTTIAHYHWLMMIDADWCWLILIGADWFWLILIDADWCFSKFQPGSERTSGVSSVIFSVKAPILQGIVWKLKMYENFPKKEIYESKVCIFRNPITMHFHNHLASWAYYPLLINAVSSIDPNPIYPLIKTELSQFIQNFKY